MNTNFKDASGSVARINKNGRSMFTSLLLFCDDVSTEAARGMQKGFDIKPQFKAEEKEALTEVKVEMAKNSTYRVVKGLLVACIAEGISLFDAKGKPKGKTALEEELAATKVAKTELDKFKSTMKTASAIAAKLQAHERLMASALVTELLKETTVGLALAA